MQPPWRFDPAQVAYYEKAGWEAYYNRQWLRVFSLMVGLNRAQFGMPWWVAVAAAFDTVRAAQAFAPVDHELATVRSYLARYFAKARRYTGIAATADELAALELNYWVVHRQLAIRRQQDHGDNDIEPLVEAFARLHAALFGKDVTAMRPSAHARALAAVAVDRISGSYTTDVAADWQEVGRQLEAAYRALVTT
ncbi:MAG: hypothetical protein R3C14_20275 [Caldilineaceae bacterium]